MNETGSAVNNFFVMSTTSTLNPQPMTTSSVPMASGVASSSSQQPPASNPYEGDPSEAALFDMYPVAGVGAVSGFPGDGDVVGETGENQPTSAKAGGADPSVATNTAEPESTGKVGCSVNV